MKILIAAAAFAVASPAAAQPAPAVDHSGHRQHRHGQHQGHGGHGQPQGQPQREGQGHDCPCCAPGADGRRPACCERMGTQQRSHSGH